MRWEKRQRSFTTIWNYITLKHKDMLYAGIYSFTTIWNYITLKLYEPSELRCRGFTTIWNYITLKHEFEHILQFGFYHYLELHHSQTSNFNLNLRIY